MTEDVNEIRERSIRNTQEFWSKRLGREVSEEEAREMIVNVTGFFKVLAKMDKRAKREQNESPSDIQERESITGKKRMRRDTGKAIQQAGKLNQEASSLKTTRNEANSTNAVDNLEDDLEESDNDSDNDVDRLIEHFYDRFGKKLSREEAQGLLDYSSK